MAVGTGGRNFKISAKNAVLLISSGKKQISPFLALRRKTYWKNPLVAPWKNSFRRPSTEACKMTPFLRKIVVLHHLPTLLNNTNAVSNP